MFDIINLVLICELMSINTYLRKSSFFLTFGVPLLKISCPFPTLPTLPSLPMTQIIPLLLEAGSDLLLPVNTTTPVFLTPYLLAPADILFMMIRIDLN